MWRGPLAYGHAGATRIFCGWCVSCRSFDERAPGDDHTNGCAADRRDEGEQRERRRQQRPRTRPSARGRHGHLPDVRLLHGRGRRSPLDVGDERDRGRLRRPQRPLAHRRRRCVRDARSAFSAASGTGGRRRRGRAGRAAHSARPRRRGRRRRRRRDRRCGLPLRDRHRARPNGEPLAARRQSACRRGGGGSGSGGGGSRSRRSCAGRLDHCRRRSGGGRRRGGGRRCGRWRRRRHRLRDDGSARARCRAHRRCGRRRSGRGRRRLRGESRGGRRRLRRSRALRARRQEPQRIEVALLVGGLPHAEMHRGIARARDERALRDRRPPRDGDRPELRERDRVSVGCAQRQRGAAPRHDARERHRPRDRRANLGAGGNGDGDAAPLPRRVRRGAVEREPLDDRPVGRPAPRGRRGDEHEHREQRADIPSHVQTAFRNEVVVR